MPRESSLPSWVLDAGRLPVAFAQVREDPLIDAWVVQKLGPEARIIMIASGGCTLSYLVATCRVARIDVVDPNPAQIALARLKLHLLRNLDRPSRLAILGHAPMSAEEREEWLGMALRILCMTAEAIGPPGVWSREGPDHAGRYERVFAQLRKELEGQAPEIEQLLSLRDPPEQARRVAPATSLGNTLDQAFDRVMDLPILIGLFGD